MYSVVLMMAMSAAPDAVDFGRRGGCSGCYGGCYSSCSGCYGSCYGGCYSSCSGCYGSCYSSCHGCNGGRGGLFSKHRSSCNGCNGGCWSSCSGCYGSSYSCHGCYGGCYGSCSGWAPVAYPYPTYSSYESYFGPAVSTGCYGYQMPQIIAPAVVPVNPMVPVEEKPMKEEDKKENKKEGTQLPSGNKAAVVVRLPADARLYADGQLTALSSAERRFYTPALEPGRDYHYTMKVEYVRDGKVVTDTKVVPVRAGQMAAVEFADLTRVASAPATKELVATKVTVKAPAGAKLFVDNQTNPLAEGTRVFNTPALPKGEEFVYSFRAEVVRDGKTQSQTQQVTFRAGDAVTVEFDGMEDTFTASK